MNPMQTGVPQAPTWVTPEIWVAVALGVLSVIVAIVVPVCIRRAERRAQEKEQRQAAEAQAWNERHRPSLNSAHDLIDSIGAIAEACIEDPQSGRELRKLGIQGLRCRMAVLETKWAHWEFHPEALVQIHAALKRLERGKGGLRDLMQGTQRIPRDRQIEAARLILDQSANAKQEVERQYYRPVRQADAVPSQLNRRARRRARDGSGELPAI